jgi:hypothetical protein
MLADSLDGPWSPREQVKLSSGDTPAPKSWHKPDTFCNPSPLRRGSASNVSSHGLYVAYRAGKKSGGEFVSVAVEAKGASGPFVDNRTAPAVANTGEDPFL